MERAIDVPRRLHPSHMLVSKVRVCRADVSGWTRGAPLRREESDEEGHQREHPGIERPPTASQCFVNGQHGLSCSRRKAATLRTHVGFHRWRPGGRIWSYPTIRHIIPPPNPRFLALTLTLEVEISKVKNRERRTKVHYAHALPNKPNRRPPDHIVAAAQRASPYTEHERSDRYHKVATLAKGRLDQVKSQDGSVLSVPQRYVNEGNQAEDSFKGDHIPAQGSN
ncbi:hypothetical protein DFP72DRAFT_1040336 [Ephemerocybe angulata]|uniref:Uncharacterized protein n=1 Tax=Ephemerocybe angulata TaxID=980116 RepID=A0A8H6IFP4_9AGAR|nr:hypothetical protein DFP72DRAFT_1040336 [Tulosesus angulatus]